MIGRASKRACHTGRGLRHRAFLVMLYNSRGELLLARRHRSKWLWPGWWDGTVAGHVETGETYLSAARRRVFEEAGVRPRLRRTDKFLYEARWKNDGENEVCAIFTGRVEAVVPHPREIDALRWVKVPRGRLVPWLRIALGRGRPGKRAKAGPRKAARKS
ncbi:MAG TPA: NUDIX domain-containing protein [Planctomycetota bacterium]|nr:NUDIX domain-containing protein [Planctomycetota bacterium]